MRNYVDFHVHIDYYKNYNEVFINYERNKIYALFVTNFPEVYRKAKDTFPNSKYVKIALGYHPEMIEIMPFNKREFEKHINQTIYLGEVGLDYSKRHYKNRDKQIEVFRYVCQRASEEGKILSLHSRRAEKDVFRFLREYNVQYGVFHWYTGSISLLQEILSSGYYLSLNPSMLKTKKGREIIKSVPLERILVETDGPYGKMSNRHILPDDIPKVYSELEELLGINNLRDIVFQNLNKLLFKQLEELN